MKNIKSYKDFINESKVILDTVMGDDPNDDKRFKDYLKKNNIKMKVVTPEGPGGKWPEVEYTANRTKLEKMIDDLFDDEELKKYIK